MLYAAAGVIAPESHKIPLDICGKFRLSFYSRIVCGGIARRAEHAFQALGGAADFLAEHSNPSVGCDGVAHAIVRLKLKI